VRAQARKFTFVNKRSNFCLGIKGYGDGTYNTLTVFDKAGNKAENTITVMVDNTVPIIGDVSWTEPKENETVKVFLQ
jgi:hypothetical protein